MRTPLPKLTLFFTFLLPLFSQGQAPGWTAKANFEGPARHRAVAITIANRGYAGLGHINAVTDVLFDDWWEYDPGANCWTQKATYPGGARMHSSAFAIGNFGYVACGRDDNSTSHNDLYEYDAVNNTWTQKASIPASGRRGAVGFSVGNKGYICTGFDGSNYLRELWEYDPSVNSWVQRTGYPGQKRTSAVGFTIGNKGYLGTGDNGSPHNDFYEYYPATDTWTQKANVPPVPRMEATGFAMNGQGYIGCGCDQQSGNNYQDFWKYDPAADTWTQITDFSGAARRYMSAFVIGNRAYTLLGTSGINYNDMWEYGNLTGMEESIKEQYHVSLFPNPMTTSSTLMITSNGPPDENIRIILSDLLGKEVKRMNGVISKENVIDKSNLSPGTYIYTLYNSASLQIGTGKLIVH